MAEMAWLPTSSRDALTAQSYVCCPSHKHHGRAGRKTRQQLGLEATKGYGILALCIYILQESTPHCPGDVIARGTQ